MKLAMSMAAVALVAGGCKDDDAAKRAKTRAAAKSFWPEAPVPAVTNARRTLAYQPANFGTYKISGKAGTDPGAEANVQVTIDLDIAFRAGKSPGRHEATMKRL